MKTLPSYPFYASLRFRFGLIFGFIFLIFLLITGFALYANVKAQFEKSFATKLQNQGNAVLRETGINPLTVPLPAMGEYFQLIYRANNKTDTLFNNLPVSVQDASMEVNPLLWRYKALSTKLETGGSIQLLYMLPATELVDDINRLRLILFLYFPLSFLPAFVVGYMLSGFLLRPVENIVQKADEISLKNQIVLLQEPAVPDELHKLTASLNKMLTRIQHQAQQQNAFFASASHELRTPLSIMLTELQILQNDQLQPTVRPVIANQIAEVQRLSKVVNDFLLMSQLKSGALALNQSVVSIAEITMEILERLAGKAQLKKQTFKVELLPNDGMFEAFTDRSHLITILSNLIQNAVKHGRAGSRIDIKITRSDQELLVQIRNVSTAHIHDPALLTSEFSKQNFDSEGSGLGLWIVSRLCEIIGAKLSISYTAPDFQATLLLPAC